MMIRSAVISIRPRLLNFAIPLSRYQRQHRGFAAFSDSSLQEVPDKNRQKHPNEVTKAKNNLESLGKTIQEIRDMQTESVNATNALKNEIRALRRDVNTLLRRTTDLVEQNIVDRFPGLGPRCEIGSVEDLLTALYVPRHQSARVAQKLVSYAYSNRTSLVNKVTGKKFSENDEGFRSAYKELVSQKQALDKEENQDEDDDDDCKKMMQKSMILTELIALWEAAYNNEQQMLNHTAAMDYLETSEHLLVPLVLTSDRFANINEANDLKTTLEMDGFRLYDSALGDVISGIGIAEIKSFDETNHKKAREQLFLRFGFFDEVIYQAYPEMARTEADYTAHLSIFFYDTYSKRVDTRIFDVTKQAVQKCGEMKFFKGVFSQEMPQQQRRQPAALLDDVIY